MWILTVFRVRECRCWGQLNYYQGLKREEKQFKNAAFCCISFWPEYRNVSRRISSIPGGWAVRRCYVRFVVFPTRNAVAGVSFLAVDLCISGRFPFRWIKFSSETVIWFLRCASFLSFFCWLLSCSFSCSARGCFFFFFLFFFLLLLLFCLLSSSSYFLPSVFFFFFLVW